MSKKFTYYGSFASEPYFTNLFGIPFGAYSLRKLSPNATYSGAAIRVRRSSDNTEQDIDFVSSSPDAGIDTTALSSFVGANNGFVVTWYNQNGSGDHFEQTTANLQPQIVFSGTIQTLNSLPTIYLDNTQFLQQDIFAGKSLLDIYIVRETSKTTYLKFTGINLVGSGFDFVAQSGSGSTGLIERYGSPSLYANKTAFSGTTRGDVYTFLDGTKIETQENANTNASIIWSFFRFGWYTSSGFAFEGNASELIIFDTSKSSQRNDIVDNQNAIYNVF